MIVFDALNIATKASSEGLAVLRIVPYLPIVITGTKSLPIDFRTLGPRNIL